jgi:hypothetical protein
MPKGDLLVARRVCRSDMEGSRCAIFNGSSSSRKTAPMFVGLIERKAWDAATALHRDRRRWALANSILTRPACFGCHEFNGLAKSIALKRGLKRHLQAYALCLQGAIWRAAAAASLTGRCRCLPMPLLGWAAYSPSLVRSSPTETHEAVITNYVETLKNQHMHHRAGATAHCE